jgi:type IV pilus assembly protein PilY1
MNKTATRFLHLAAAAALTAVGCAAMADEAEIFVGTGNAVSNERPNILFIIDSSGSMSEDVTTQVPFTPATDWPGSCADDRVYFETGSNSSDPPKCTNNNSVPLAAFKCQAALTAMSTAGYYVADRAAQWRGSGPRWRGINGNTGNSVWVECKADAGVHGDGVNFSRLWAADAGNGPWTSSSAQAIKWDSNGANQGYVFYSGNYINWLDNSSTITQTRLEIVQQVATNTINQLAVDDQVNVGLMQYSNNTNGGCGTTGTSEGGMVLRPIGPVAANKTNLINDINAINADGCTPLSETMYEAYLYLSGNKVDYGINSRKTPGSGGAFPSIASSRKPAPNTDTYESPLTVSCQRNFIVLLTDGLPTADNSANANVQTLIGHNCTGSGDGKCLDDLTAYMYTHDLRPGLINTQSATTYTIGFGPEVGGSTLLQNTAQGAGGQFYEAKDTATLSTVLTSITRDILSFNTSFTAPAVSVNAFNRTQNLNDLYITVFRPSETYNWDGNIKKYHLSAAGVIQDVNNVPAVEVTTGFFKSTSQSYWSDAVDGDKVDAGGASHELPAPATRKVYSDINTALAMTAGGNQVGTANAAITTAMLGLGAAEQPGRDNLINWLRGQDISDADGDGVTTDARQAMGDPMNGRPATVIYGGTVASPDPNDGVVYAVTNEGYLHAIDSKDGSELWAFMPKQLLARARNLYYNDAVTDRVYGLDGNIRVVKNEVNENGVVEPSLGERVLLYFGMRRGGSDVYGIDITDRNAPTLLFRIGPNETGTKQLKGAGQSWSTPAVAKINITGATQNTLQQVLVFGGGYDTAEDNGNFVATDASGNQVFFVDAISGDVLWYAAPTTDVTADLKLANMKHSIPGDVRVFDITGDGFADRMYAGDMGGRVWRFDIANGQPRTSLVTGGVFASLGNAHLATHPATTTRRFYSAPDVAFLAAGGHTWLNIAIGSGYRAHPLNIDTQDRFYSLRDHLPFAQLTQAQYNSLVAITEADTNLIDITATITPTIPPAASGWRLDLKRPSAGFTGEKNLAEARTIESMIQFTTYEPNSASTVASASCAPGVGTNRLYTVSAYTGAPVFDRESPEDPPDSVDDRDTELAQGGLAPEVVWLFPSPDNPTTCHGAECRPDPVCLVGLENCGVGVNLAPVRTFWRQTGVN